MQKGEETTSQEHLTLYLMTAIAGVEQWVATERDLFEAMLATLERGG